MSKYNYNCIDFLGYKPCKPKKLCHNCDEYKPWDRKILILKLGALGDVLRTTPVLHAFKRKYPHAHITWVTKKSAKELLETSSRIHRLIYIDDSDHGGMLRLLVEEFDELHCYDKEDSAIALASLIKAKQKFGFFMNHYGQMAPLNKASEYCFDLGLSDPLKFEQNQKTYQELTYECSELPVPAPMDPYDFQLRETDREVAQFILKRLRWDSKKVHYPIIGLNTGSGRVFRTKQWIEEYFVELAKQLKRKKQARVLLLGGQDEDAKNKRLASKLKGIAHYPGCGFSIRQFAGLLETCDATVTGDTLAMHLSLSVQTPAVVLFGSTCDQEVDLYGLGKKLVSHPECSPCYKNECNQLDWMRCMKAITPMQVFNATREILETCKNIPA